MGMMDSTLVGKVLTNLYFTSTPSTFTAGTGGSTFATTPPYRLHLMTAIGSETAAGTELASGGNYTSGFNATGGSSLGTVFAGTITTGTFTNANAVTWTVASGWATGSTITSIEIYDGASSAVRHIWGALTANISGVAIGDTISFGIASITVNASGW
jgi:hypothetical protein